MKRPLSWPNNSEAMSEQAGVTTQFTADEGMAPSALISAVRSRER